MASVLHLTPDVLPASDHPSLNLDLSLGSLFFEHHASAETMGTAESGVTDCNTTEAAIPKGRSSADISSFALHTSEPAHPLSPKVLQAQRWHAARRRRKSILEEKLLKRFNGDNFSVGEGALRQTRLSDCTMQGFEWDGYEGKASEQKLLGLGHGVALSAQPGETLDLGHSMLSGALPEMSCSLKHSSDGDVSSPVWPGTCRGLGKLRLRLPSGESDVPKHQHTHASCVPCIDSPRDQCVPCGYSPSTRCLHSQSARYSAGSIPTCASSSSICTGYMFEKRRRLNATYGEGVDDPDSKERSICNSSSSGVENEYAQNIMPNESSDSQSSRCSSKDGLAGAAHSSMSTPPGCSTAYPYAAPPVTPLSYPYGFPVQSWGSSLPWLMHYLPHMVVGAMSSMSPLLEKVNEATTFSRAHSTWDHRPAHENTLSSSHQFVPAAGTANADDQEKTKNNATAYADMEEKDRTFFQAQWDDVTSAGHLENELSKADRKNFLQKTAKFSLKADKARNHERLQKLVIKQVASMPELPVADSAPAERCKTLEALSKEPAAGEIRHRSLPDSCRRGVLKKAKLVRFNSLDNKVIQLEQEQNSDSHHEDGMSAYPINDDRAELLCARLQPVSKSHLHRTCKEHTIKGNHINRHVEDVNTCGEVDEPNVKMVHTHNDEEMGCVHADGIDDVTHAQSHASVSEDEQEDQSSIASMPRVTTRGSGPHGRIIHGVMYIKEKQARLICSCHGKHMSPVEFVQHSGSDDLSNPERSIVLRPLAHVASGLSSS